MNPKNFTNGPIPAHITTRKRALITANIYRENRQSLTFAFFPSHFPISINFPADPLTTRLLDPSSSGDRGVVSLNPNPIHQLEPIAWIIVSLPPTHDLVFPSFFSAPILFGNGKCVFPKIKRLQITTPGSSHLIKTSFFILYVLFLYAFCISDGTRPCLRIEFCNQSNNFHKIL